ncbi:hypothetical protein MRB53_009667 [Persea americana]|uniref:Uncharacterized protein n=1 Tax=Persea americana TaxID=3435 RepID=A0ACC2LPM0_PERAE|nr:hypothetical protein MRB53_009667 [Persea americana]
MSHWSLPLSFSFFLSTSISCSGVAVANFGQDAILYYYILERLEARYCRNRSLRRSLYSRGSDLIVRIGCPESVIIELAKAVGMEAIYLQREVSRDEARTEERIEAPSPALDRNLLQGSTAAANKLEEEGFQNLSCITSGLQSVKPGAFNSEGSSELQNVGKAGLVTVQGKISAVLGTVLISMWWLAAHKQRIIWQAEGGASVSAEDTMLELRT